MTIGKKELYRDYINDLKSDINNISAKTIEQLNHKQHYLKTIKSYLNDYKIIKNGKDVELDTFIEHISNISINNVSNNYEFSNSVNDDSDSDVSILRGFISKLIYCNAKIKGFNTRKKELQEFIIDRDSYYQIIDVYNQEVIRFLLDGGIYSLGGRLGYLYISGKERSVNQKSINWGESNKYKQYLIDNNQIPFKKEDADAAIANGKEYKGVKWHIYHVSKYVYYLKWVKPLLVKNIRLFSIAPNYYNHTGCSKQELLDTCKFSDIPNLNIGMREKIVFSTEFNNDHYVKFLNNNIKKDELQFN